ncbi:MAG TPA: adenylosuccinate lyase, partial [Bacillota bacterium]
MDEVITMSSGILDLVFFEDLLGTAEMRQLFSSRNLLQKWLDFEAALARAEAKLGLIPEAAAQEITEKARAENFDLNEIKKGVEHTLHPIVPVIRALA